MSGKRSVPVSNAVNLILRLLIVWVGTGRLCGGRSGLMVAGAGIGRFGLTIVPLCGLAGPVRCGSRPDPSYGDWLRRSSGCGGRRNRSRSGFASSIGMMHPGGCHTSRFIKQSMSKAEAACVESWPSVYGPVGRNDDPGASRATVGSGAGSLTWSTFRNVPPKSRIGRFLVIGKATSSWGKVAVPQ